jgi:hypothetical protein
MNKSCCRIDRRTLSPKTLELYEGLLRNHLNPTFREMSIGDIK